MRLLNPESENMDEIGKKVLKAIRAEEQDIDGIVTMESLFDPVRMAIRAGRRKSVDTSRFLRVGFNVRRWQLAAASIAVLAFGIFGVAYFVRQMAPSREIVRDKDQQSSPVEILPSPEVKPDEISSSDVAGVSTYHDVYRSHVSKTRHIAKKQQQSQIEEEVGEFQALTFTGNTAEADSETKIVRVELPRSSLFAMGIDVPVENQTTNKVKADLLVGEDGVMKAVRIVN